MTKVKKTIAVKVVLETEYFTLYSDGKMIGKMDTLKELAKEANEGTPFWYLLDKELMDLKDGNSYVSNTGNAPDDYILGITNAPAFFLGVYERKNKLRFDAIYCYVEYERFLWEEILLEEGEVMFTKI
jgi:hypothetical protein